jgi:hypothetical protein
MCGGATSTQSELQGEEADFYKNQIASYNKAYSQFTDLTNTLNQQFAPILQAGPGQMGYTPAELADLNTVAASGTASAYANATRALNEQMGTMGGGTSPVNATSGPAAAARAALASTAASQAAQQRLQIQSSGYDVGRQQYQQAVTGEESLAAGWNPNTFAGSTVSSGGLASSEANTIAQQQQSAWGSVLSAVGGVAGAALGNPAGLAGMFSKRSGAAPMSAPQLPSYGQFGVGSGGAGSFGDTNLGTAYGGY